MGSQGTEYDLEALAVKAIAEMYRGNLGLKLTEGRGTNDANEEVCTGWSDRYIWPVDLWTTQLNNWLQEESTNLSFNG